MKKFFLLLLLMSSASFALAQAHLPSIIEITEADKTIGKIDGTYWQVLPDSTAKLNQEQVATAEFFPVKGNTYPVKSNSQFYWLRYRLKNTLDRPVTIIISGKQTRSDLYIVREGKKAEKRTTGKGVKWNELSPNRRIKQFDIELSAGEQIALYQRNQFDRLIDDPAVSLELGSSANAFSNWEATYEDLLHSRINGAFMSGFSLLAAIVTFFFFIVVRERLYVYFSSFVFLISLICFVISYDDFFVKRYPVQTAYAIQILVMPTLLLAIRFVLLFNQTKSYFPRWHRANYWANYGLLVAMLAIFLPWEYQESLIGQAGTLVCVLIMVSSILLTLCSIIKNKKRLTFHISVVAPILIALTGGVILGLFFDKGNNLLATYLPVLFRVSFYWLLIAFSWDLILQFRRMIKKNEVEKLALIELQKVELEEQVIARTRELNQSLKRSDTLLLNILPEDVAEELKEKGSSQARLFDQVTVLFTDFVNFTTISEMLTPQELVDELHYCFKAFDQIISRYQIEKIKTIGDAYLAVSGLPNPSAVHAQNIINAAIEIRDFVSNRKEQMGDRTFAIRIGVHSGSVVAGIVGIKKFAYDIWGDTVNTAARMEQNSEKGKINVSESTYTLVRDQFGFTYRGEIMAKNKGNLKMYFVN